MRNLITSGASGFALGLASFLVLATAPAGAAGPPAYPEDIYDVTARGDTIELTTKGDKSGKKHDFQVQKGKTGTPNDASIEAHVRNKANGKTASFELFGGGGMIQATRGNNHVVLRITHDGVQVFRYVGVRSKTPERKVGPQPVDAPKVEATCQGSDAACIAGAIRRVIPDLDPEELGALIVLLRDDLRLLQSGDKILATLTKLAGR